jgi:hypothetical protein
MPNGRFARMLHAHDLMKDNAEVRVLTLMVEAGLWNAANKRSD